jgi:hypothetical protein
MATKDQMDSYDDGVDMGMSEPEQPGVAKAGGEKADTALVPRGFLPDDVTVGQTCKVRVVKLLEDQAQVEYAGTGGGESDEYED